MITKAIRTIVNMFIEKHSRFLVRLFYRDIWNLKAICLEKQLLIQKKLYYSYLESYGSWIGLGASFEEIPVFPHGLHGIFISNKAKIGKNVVIFHQVTIGSNSLADSSNNGSPEVGDNVYIGCGAKIIGNVRIGENSRIGANCIITKNVPANSLCVIRGLEIIHKENMNNEFIHVVSK